jgi:hypothetical protein
MFCLKTRKNTPFSKHIPFPRGLLLLLGTLLFQMADRASAITRFVVHATTDRSIVVRMVDAEGVARFDMRALIFHLDRQRKFRRSELTSARPQSSQVTDFKDFCE